MRRISLFAFLIINACLLQASNIKELLEKANVTFNDWKFDEALSIYEQILQLEPDNDEARYYSTIASHLTTTRGNDVSDILSFESTKGTSDTFYNYWLGRIYFLRYEFNLAEQRFRDFLDLENYTNQKVVQDAERHITWIAQAKTYYNNPNEYELITLEEPINTKYSEISPFVDRDQNTIVFTSSRQTDSTAFHYQVYTAVKTGSNWQINPSMSTEDAEGLFQEKFLYDEGSGENLPGNLDPGYRLPRGFENNIAQGRIGTEFFVSERNDLIVFSFKTQNGDDLYQFKMNEFGQWGTAKILKGGANSKWNEQSPFVSRDGRFLFFSSDRPSSIGGYDVYKCELDSTTGMWGEAQNLGFPINTIDNEIHFKLNYDNISGYLSSNRLHGVGGYDIYYFHKAGSVIIEGIVSNKVTGDTIPGAKLHFYPIAYLDEKIEITSDENGFFKSEIFSDENFRVEVFIDGEKMHEEEFNTELEERVKLFEKNIEVTFPTPTNTGSTESQGFPVNSQEGEN